MLIRLSSTAQLRLRARGSSLLLWSRWLIETLKKEFPIKVIAGHRDFSPDLNGNGTVEPEEWIKECPCFDVKAEF